MIYHNNVQFFLRLSLGKMLILLLKFLENNNITELNNKIDKIENNNITEINNKLDYLFIATYFPFSL